MTQAPREDGAVRKRWSGGSWLWTLLKLAISAGLILWLFDRFAPEFSGLSQIRPLPLAGALGIALCLPIINAWRWHIILRTAGEKTSLARLAAVYQISNFFTHVLPSLTGEIVRLAYARHLKLSLTAVFSSTLIDRLTSLFVLLLLASFGVSLYFDLGTSFQRLIVLACMGAGILLAGVCLTSARFSTLIRTFAPQALQRMFGAAAAMARRLIASPLAAGGVFLLALITYALAGAILALITQALATPIRWTDALLLTPVILAAAAIPVSTSGWGLREAAAVSVLPLAGLKPEAALPVSIVFGLVTTTASLPGLAAWILLGKGSSRSHEFTS